MHTILTFSLTLIVAVYISTYAQRSILSTAVLFLLVGVGAGSWPFKGMGVTAAASIEMVKVVSEITLFAVLFTDGMQVSPQQLAHCWRLPGRALLLGMPLTFAGTTAAVHWIAGEPWLPSMLVGAILSPTDPVLVEAIVGHEGVPRPLRVLLNIESGLNDGLALPAVIILLALLSGSHQGLLQLLLQVGLGIVVGVVIPLVVVKIELHLFPAVPLYKRLLPFAIGLLLYSVSSVLQVNEFLAAFTGGIMVATINPGLQISFNEFGEYITELLKLAAIMLFGSLISVHYILSTDVSTYIFIFLALFVVRPVTLSVSLLGSDFPWDLRLVAGWFGPKGFASVVYSLLLIHSNVPNKEKLYHLTALVVIGSIFLHSSSDVPINRWLVKKQQR